MLKPSERERLQDCLLLIQSARDILAGIGSDLLPDLSSIEKCFRDADRSISELLRA
jgi:hypothetical protein